MSIYPDYIAAKNNYDSLSHGSWNWNPSYDSLDRSFRELESCVGMIMKVLDKNQQKQFDAKFK
jgi:hypothetical protein